MVKLRAHCPISRIKLAIITVSCEIQWLLICIWFFWFALLNLGGREQSSPIYIMSLLSPFSLNSSYLFIFLFLKERIFSGSVGWERWNSCSGADKPHNKTILGLNNNTFFYMNGKELLDLSFLYEGEGLVSSCVSAAQNMCVLSGNPDPPMWSKFNESWRWGANSTSLGWDWEHHLRLCGQAGSCKFWQICLVPDFRLFVPKVKVVRAGPEVCSENLQHPSSFRALLFITSWKSSQFLLKMFQEWLLWEIQEAGENNIVFFRSCFASSAFLLFRVVIGLFCLLWCGRTLFSLWFTFYSAMKIAIYSRYLHLENYRI